MVEQVIGGWKLNNAYCSDAISFMMSLPGKSIDMVLVDPPYGTTSCVWDEVIPLQKMWQQIVRIVKPDAAIAITSSQPFTSILVASNLDMWRFEYSWHKGRVTGFLDAKKKPLKAHESVNLFSRSSNFKYRPQVWQSNQPKSAGRKSSRTDVYGHFGMHYYSSNGERQPTSILVHTIGAKERGLKPTQKPLELFKRLILQHSDPGDVILDFCIGSGTTGLAALETGRRFIGCDIEMADVAMTRRRTSNYKMPMFEIAQRR